MKVSQPRVVPTLWRAFAAGTMSSASLSFSTQTTAMASSSLSLGTQTTEEADLPLLPPACKGIVKYVREQKENAENNKKRGNNDVHDKKNDGKGNNKNGDKQIDKGKKKEGSMEKRRGKSANDKAKKKAKK